MRQISSPHAPRPRDPTWMSKRSVTTSKRSRASSIGLPLALELAAALGTHPAARDDPRAARRTAAVPDRRRAGSARAAADALGDDRLELRASQRRGAAHVPDARRLRRRRVPGRGRQRVAAPGRTLELLTSLCDKSLLLSRTADDGSPRFAMLETIREFAFARLAELGRETETQTLARALLPRPRRARRVRDPGTAPGDARCSSSPSSITTSALHLPGRPTTKATRCSGSLPHSGGSGTSADT